MGADRGTEGRAKRLPPEERRRHLVEAALGVFAERGYAGTELADVAEAAGVGRPLIYHYFESGKEDLYVAVLELAWARLVERLQVDPERGRGMLAENLPAYLDLVESGDPAVLIIRGSRRLEGTRTTEATRNASLAMAHGMAMNQLGVDDPSPAVLAGFLGFLAFFETLLQEWMRGEIERADVERIVSAALPALADAVSG
jgi:AcrR family transcriptional regulator